MCIMNIYYMSKQNKGYKQIAKTEQKFARIIKTISFIARYDHCDAMLQVNYPSAKANGIASLLQLNIY